MSRHELPFGYSVVEEYQNCISFRLLQLFMLQYVLLLRLSGGATWRTAFGKRETGSLPVGMKRKVPLLDWCT
ncbi:hypothetical protein lerEdw1_013294 [Lerista edwardsae]|nr:hypothetical protein lerEdw1_013294 [Lerista edwardsae]